MFFLQNKLSSDRSEWKFFLKNYQIEVFSESFCQSLWLEIDSEHLKRPILPASLLISTYVHGPCNGFWMQVWQKVENRSWMGGMPPGLPVLTAVYFYYLTSKSKFFKFLVTCDREFKNFSFLDSIDKKYSSRRSFQKCKIFA